MVEHNMLRLWRQRCLRWRRCLPVAETFGVLVGVLGFDLIMDGRPNILKAVLSAGIFGLVLFVWRCRRPGHRR